jgi:crossover junction endodeoxyribonuclease RusA
MSLEILSSERKKVLRLEIPAIPPSVNHYWKARGKRRFLTKRAREWKGLVRRLVRKQLPHHKLLTGRLSVKVTLCVRYRRGDVDNRLKAILDAFNGLVWVDDRQVDFLSIERRIEASERTIVEVVEV